METSNKQGLLVNWKGYFLPSLKRKVELENLDFSPEDLLNKYRGIDGYHWPQSELVPQLLLKDGLVQAKDIRRVEDYLSRLHNFTLCDLLYISMQDTSPPNGFEFCGYDFGFCESEFNHYSVLLNEVLCGKYKELTDFHIKLNGNMLIDSFQSISEIRDLRNAMASKYADLELIAEDEMFYEIAVYVKPVFPKS